MSLRADFLRVADWLPDPLVLVRLDSTVLAANRSAAATLGVGRDAPEMRLAARTAGPEERLWRYLREASRTRSPIPGALVLHAADGEPISYRCDATLYQPGTDGQDSVVLLRFTERNANESRFEALNRKIEDLKRERLLREMAETERRRRDAQLVQTQKLESLGILAGGIAHDFNNLLTGILGYADLAIQALPEGSAARADVEAAAQGARQAAELTRQMLAFAGKGRFLVKPVSLSSVIAETTRLLDVSISKKCVLQYELRPDLPSCHADVSQVRQVAMNLIINASEAIGDRSGLIAVKTGVMDCDRTYLAESYLDDDLAEGQYVYLEVADTGEGMTESTRARIFEPFFSSKFTGRGLGLAAVLGIVRGHHGAIKVYSEPGRGTTFKVLFPASEEAAEVETEGGAGAADWRGEGLVLIVDDEESVRSMSRRILERVGFSVITACDGRDALESFRKRGDEIRIVLLDMTMPHMDGEQTFREMHRLRPGVKVILSSGYNEQTATQRFVGRGLAAFIQKPYAVADLVATVRKVLGE